MMVLSGGRPAGAVVIVVTDVGYEIRILLANSFVWW
jgi:hypothetical protein